MPAGVAQEITTRMLEPEEWGQVIPIFESFGGEAPHPALSRIAVAFEGDELIGFWTVQPVMHSEPLWVKPGHAKESIWPKLLKALVDDVSGAGGTVREFYAFPEDPRWERVLPKFGFEKLNVAVWRKKVG